MELNVNTGLVKYNLAGKVSVEFNPTDVAFAEKLYTAFQQLDEKQDEYKERLEKATEAEALFTVGRDIDAEMKETINGIFGKDVMTPLIGDMSAYAMADGLPVWANIILAIIDVMDASITEEAKKSATRIDKYTKKYHR